MEWENVKNLNDIQEIINKRSTIPSKIVDNELHLLMNNKDFESFKENLGDNILIKIKDLEVFDYNLKFTVSAEKDGVELISITNYYNTSWEDYPEYEIWHWTLTKLIEKNIIPQNEFELSSYSIFQTHEPNFSIKDRVVKKYFKDVFSDFSPEELDTISTIIINEDPGFYIDIDFYGGIDNNSIATIDVFSMNHPYEKRFECHVFDVKKHLEDIRKDLEEIGICKKKEN